MPSEPPRLIAPRTQERRLPTPPAPDLRGAGEAWVAAGQALQAVSRQAAARYVVEKNRQRKARYDEVLAQAADMRRRILLGDDQNPGALQATGKDAIGIGTDESPYLQQWDQWGKPIVASIDDPTLKQQVASALERERIDLQTKLQEHELQQVDAFTRETARLRLQALEDDLQADYRDDARWEVRVDEGARVAVRMVRGYSGREEAEATANVDFLLAHQDIPWVQRILEPDGRAVQNPDGSVSTHLMSYGEADGRYFVFPTVYADTPGGPLRKHDAAEAAGYWLKRGGVIWFDDEKKAEKFAAGGYKRGTWMDDDRNLAPATGEEKAVEAAWRSGNVRARIMRLLDDNDVEEARRVYEKYGKWLVDHDKAQDRTMVLDALEKAEERHKVQDEAVRIVDMWKAAGYDPNVIDEEIRKLDPNLRENVLRAIDPMRNLALDEKRFAEQKRMETFYERAAAVDFDLNRAFTDAEWVSLTPEEQADLLQAASRWHARKAMGAASATDPGDRSTMDKEQARVRDKYLRWKFEDDPERRARSMWFSAADKAILASIDPKAAEEVGKWQAQHLKGVKPPALKYTDEKIRQVARHYGIISDTSPAHWTPDQMDMMAAFTHRVNLAIEARQEAAHDQLTRTEIDKIIDETAGNVIKMRKPVWGRDPVKDVPLAFLTGTSKFVEKWEVDVADMDESARKWLEESLLPYAKQFQYLPAEAMEFPEDPDEASRIATQTIRELAATGHLPEMMVEMQKAQAWRTIMAVAQDAMGPGKTLSSDDQLTLAASVREWHNHGLTEHQIRDRVRQFAQAHAVTIGKTATPPKPARPTAPGTAGKQQQPASPRAVPGLGEELAPPPEVFRPAIDTELQKQWQPEWERIYPRLKESLYRRLGEKYPGAGAATAEADTLWWNKVEPALQRIDMKMRRYVLPHLSVMDPDIIKELLGRLEVAPEQPFDRAWKIVTDVERFLDERLKFVRENPQEAIEQTSKVADAYLKRLREGR